MRRKTCVLKNYCINYDLLCHQCHVYKDFRYFNTRESAINNMVAYDNDPYVEGEKDLHRKDGFK